MQPYSSDLAEMLRSPQPYSSDLAAMCNSALQLRATDSAALFIRTRSHTTESAAYSSDLAVISNSAWQLRATDSAPLFIRPSSHMQLDIVNWPGFRWTPFNTHTATQLTRLHSTCNSPNQLPRLPSARIVGEYTSTLAVRVQFSGHSFHRGEVAALKN